MFSPASRTGTGAGRTRTSSSLARTPALSRQDEADRRLAAGDSVATPPSSRFSTDASLPESGMLPPPSPWLQQSALTSRVTPMLRSEDRSAAHGSEPTFISDFPHQLRNAMAGSTFKQRAGTPGTLGGIDGKIGLSWMVYRNQIHIWSHLGGASQEPIVLEIPSQFCTADRYKVDLKHGDQWLVSVISRHEEDQSITSVTKGCNSAGLVMCSKKSLGVIYWPDVYSDASKFSFLASPINDKQLDSADSNSSSLGKALIACSTSNVNAVVFMSSRNGDLWRLDCTPGSILWEHVRDPHKAEGKDSSPSNHDHFAAGSLVWKSNTGLSSKGLCQFLLLTEIGIECWDAEISGGKSMSESWFYDISQDKSLQDRLSGQREVRLLDLQVQDDAEKSFTVLATSVSDDQATGSSFMQYSLLVFNNIFSKGGEKKTSVQVILEKAKLETRDFLHSIRLRIGGKPDGSAMILVSDGTATVAYYLHGVARLYQFTLAWDAGRVLDASVLSGSEENNGGAWIVLTEKAGVWAVPEKAVLLCASQQPSFSHAFNIVDQSLTNKKHLVATPFSVNLDKGVKESLGEKRARQRPLLDEEAEATVGRLFQLYLSSKQVTGVLEKLQQAGAFGQDGETNVFVRTSKVIIDTLAKQWMTGGAGAAVMLVVSSQLLEKRRRHQQYLSFLVASKCHDVLKHQQRSALHAIMEHAEKLIAVIELKDLHNARAEARQQLEDSGQQPSEIDLSDVSGALWDTIQVVGEKARRKNVMLMERDKAEVFFTRVSEFEEFFACLEQHVHAIVGQDQSLKLRIERLCEIADACTIPLRAAIHYRDMQQAWYPAPEGLTPWYCKASVRSGVWAVAALIIHLRTEADIAEPSMKEALILRLEELTDIVLESYAGAITAKVEREEEYKGLQMEYWDRREKLFGVLQQHAREVADEAAQVATTVENREQQKLGTLKEKYVSLMALARRHAGYQTLWEICNDLNDVDCLRGLMHESMGLREGRFSNFVFEQCLQKGQLSRLLRLGEEFEEELASFLHDHKSLAWLHDIYMQRFQSASNTLHSLALSDGKRSERFEMSAVGKPNREINFSKRKRLLYLAKLAALAGGGSGAQEKAARIDADIEILKVQELAASLGAVGSEVLTPLELVEVCLNSGVRELILHSLDLFAMAGDAFRIGNKSLLEAAWLKIASQDDWIKMKQASQEEGWSAEQQREALKMTSLYQASERCYGANSMVYGTPFDEVMPLLQDDVMQTFDSITKSVEDVLMQTPDFSEVGEAMLTAIKLGKLAEPVFDGHESDEMIV